MSTIAILEAATAALRGLEVLRFIDRRQLSRVAGSPPRMGKGRTHKASSAEAILKHCLRQRGWTRQHARDELTGRQRLGLLDDIRQYGRMWIRHEAESFFDRYGVEDGTSRGNARSLVARMESTKASGSGRGLLQNGEDSLEGITEVAVSRGIISSAAGAVRRFFSRVRQFLHELIHAGAMGLSGPDELSAAEVSALDREARIQAEYLDRFEQEVIARPPASIAEPELFTVQVSPPAMTPGQFTARAESYGNSVWQAVHRANRTQQVNAGIAQLERRVLGHPRTEHCEDCPPIAAMGWQPIGTLPQLGDTECGGRCLCHFEYMDRPADQGGTPFVRQPAIPSLPGGPGPSEKPKPPKAAPPEPPKTVDELIQEAGGPWPGVEYHYEEAP